MTKEEGWVSSRYSPSDIQDSLQLARKTLGDVEMAAPDYQDWQCQQGPAGAAIGILARDGQTGQLVGQALTIPVKVRLSGELGTAGLSLNPLTDPDYQGGDVAADLLKDVCALAAAEEVAFSYGFPNQASHTTFVNRAGFRDVGAVPLLIRPLSPERLAMKTTGSRVVARTASIARLVWRTPSPAPPQEHLPGLDIAEVSSFDEPFALFWHRVRHRFPVMVVRDPAYLNWRFIEAPAREHMIFAARSEGKIRGYIVLRVAPLGRFTAGLIMDLIVEASGEGRAAGRLLIDQAYSYFQDRDLDILAGLALRHTDEYRLLRSRGFWVSPKFLEPQSFRLVVHSHKEEAGPSGLAYRLRNWFLTMADCEAV
jgi:GNAT superfamily N-acetyltransferase